MFRLNIEDDVNVNSKAVFNRFSILRRKKHEGIFFCRLTVDTVITLSDKLSKC